MSCTSTDVSNKAHAAFDALIRCNTQECLMREYDNIAQDYDRLSDSTGYTGHIYTAEKVAEVEPNRCALILDVGCGTGRVGQMLQKAGYNNLHGVDLSEQSLEMAAKKGIYRELTRAHFGPKSPLNKEDGTLDLAVSVGCFLPMHMNHTQVPEMIRLVKKGGYLIITTRKEAFEQEEGNMRLKSCLIDLADQRILRKVFHDYFILKKKGNMLGISICYQVL